MLNKKQALLFSVAFPSGIDLAGVDQVFLDKIIIHSVNSKRCFCADVHK